MRIGVATASLGLALALLGIAGAIADDAPCVDLPELGTVAAVEDARTLRLADGRALRLAGIEPIAVLYPDPAAASAAAQVLARRLETLSAGREIVFGLVEKLPDRYGRLPAMMEIGGDLVQKTLLREGLAVAFAAGPEIPCFEALLAAESDARRAGRGFWADAAVPFAVPAALEGRTGLFTIFEGNVLTVGNRASRTYLNFGRRWSEDVTVEIPAADRAAVGGAAGRSDMAGPRVRVRGVLQGRNGPLLTVTSPAQIEILGPPPQAAPGPANVGESP